MIQQASAGGSAGRCLASLIASLAISLATAFTPSVGRAQDAWPSRSITLIVPYAAGGYTDLVGRLVARHVETALGKPVVIVNRAGAGG
jgi:tripartite-type tricarboxylate transporter receptor subunit TctC